MDTNKEKGSDGTKETLRDLIKGIRDYQESFYDDPFFCLLMCVGSHYEKEVKEDEKG